MNGLPVSRDVGCRLASYIEDRRRELVASVVAARSPDLRPIAATAFADGFLQRLCEELLSGETVPVDAWADAHADPAAAIERGDVVTMTCATVASGFAIDCEPSTEISAYLASRASDVGRRLRGEGPIVMPRSRQRAAAGRDATVQSLLSAMEARDRITCEHSRAVGMWCGRLAQSLGFDAERAAEASLAGTLHDVGKIATPSEILLKPSPLDSAEWETMRAHASIGAKMLERFPELRELAPAVRAHHERFDGTGYPDGLSGEDIPFLARIIAVADAFHAMISKRPYREALPVALAVRELKAGAGLQWDPAVVSAMLTIVEPQRLRPTLRAARGGL